MTGWPMSGWIRALTPVGWIITLAIGVLITVVVAGGVGLRWDPLNLSERRLRAQTSRNETLTADLTARRLEAQAGVEQRATQAARHTVRTNLVRATAVAQAQLRNADDAEHPLDPGRLERLRAHDNRLCELAPGVCVDRATPDGPAN